MTKTQAFEVNEAWKKHIQNKHFRFEAMPLLRQTYSYMSSSYAIVQKDALKFTKEYQIEKTKFDAMQSQFEFDVGVDTSFFPELSDIKSLAQYKTALLSYTESPYDVLRKLYNTEKMRYIKWYLSKGYDNFEYLFNTAKDLIFSKTYGLPINITKQGRDYYAAAIDRSAIFDDSLVIVDQVFPEIFVTLIKALNNKELYTKCTYKYSICLDFLN